jgi:cobalt-zinc-cadmium efflux system outer membrane protein
LLSLASPLPSVAQQPARLTLQQALELAEKQNLDLAAARRRRDVSLAGVRIARQIPNPTVNFTALRDSPHEGLFFGQPIELGGKRGHRMEVAHQEGRLTEVEISALSRQVRRETRLAYYRLAFARAESDRLAQVLGLARRLKQIAQERFEAGAVPQLEVIQGELEVSRAEAEYKIAAQVEKVALSELNALLNEPSGTPWELAEALAELPPSYSIADLVQRANATNATLEHLAQEQKVEQSRRALLKAQRVPNLELELGTDFNSPPDFRVGPRSQIGLTIPLFTRNRGEIAQSLANERVLEGEAEATRRSMAGRVESAFLGLNAQQTRVEIYRQTVLPTARQLERMSEESYRAGKSSLLVVIEAQRNVREAERGYLEGLLGAHNAFAVLEETVGAPLDGGHP